MLSDNEKRLVGLFRQFMQKSIVPTIKSYGPVMNDWHAFNSIISQEPLDYAKIQSFVETKSNPVKMFQGSGYKKDDDKLKTNSGFLKRKDDLTAPQSPIPEAPGTYTFSSNKTFGGDRARMNMFPLSKPPGGGTTTITPIIQKKEENNSRAHAVDRILNSIESLYKTLADNQQRFEQRSTNHTAPSSLAPSNPYRYEQKKYDRM